MKLIRRIFFSKVMMTVLGCLVVGLIIWFIGPLLGYGDTRPLGGTVQRALLTALLPSIFALQYGFVAWRERQQNGETAAAMSGSAAGQREVEDLGSRLKEALDTLKKSRFSGSSGKKFLYQLPWYMFIGPPGSGKTTALTNSGLNFPLAAKFGKGAIKGVGGTRSCDWWFTDDAVLIDTAGRYTTQDSEAEADKTAWLGFLKLLKQYRKRQPLNGVLVAIGISDLTGVAEAQRLEHAQAIRQRVAELYTQLGVRLPVYVLFTKSDLMAGFVEFFDDLSREDRDSVWGMTFGIAKKDEEGGVITHYGDEFDALVGRLDDRLTERLQQESDTQRRSLVFGFPQQFASLKEITQKFLEEAFAPNRYEQPVLLRGVYFTSGTQDGTPIDRLMGAMASTFGIGRQMVPSLSNTGRSYFLGRLLRQVVFGEAGLVNADPKVEKRARRIQIAAYGGAALLVLGMGALWTVSYFNNKTMIDTVTTTAADYDSKVAALKVNQVADSDVTKVVPLLNTLRDLPDGYAHQDEDPANFMGMGLYQGEKVGSEARAAYFRALSGMLLPRLLLRLETQLNANQSNTDFLYEGLKVYLMLGRQGPLDKELVKQWMGLDWSTEFPGNENAQLRADLTGHLQALLKKSLPELQLNGPLVAQCRDILDRLPLAERAYSQIKTNPKVTELPEWRISDNAGPAADRVFVRTSGKSLADGISGLYTYDGFFKAFRPLLPGIANEVAKESWVLGAQAAGNDNPAALDRLQRDVTNLYLEDFSGQWERLLADITIQPNALSTANAAATLNVLSAPDSPLKQFVMAAAHETTLSKAPPADLSSIDPTAALTQAAGGAAQKMPGQATASAAGGGALTGAATNSLSQLFGGGQKTAGGTEDIAGKFTDQRFKALHDLAGQPGQPAQIDSIVASLGDLYHWLLAAAPPGGGAPSPLLGAAGAGPASATEAANRAPEPVKTLLLQVVAKTTGVASGGTRSHISDDWNTNVAQFCKQATENRYPIYKTGSQEVTIDDFSRLFSKGGLIDTFFATDLKPYVDTSKQPWRSQKTDNQDLGLSPAVLIQFERAAHIRDSMFPTGTKPGVSFNLVPTTLDSVSTQVLVEIDGQSLTYDHGPPRPARMEWPGPGPSGVRISFQPQGAGDATTIVKDGVWAWFRLLDDAHITPSGGPDKFNVTFNVGSRSAGFQIQANSVVNPFSSDEISQFRCPPL